MARSTIPLVLKKFDPLWAQPDAAHSGPLEVSLAMATEALAYRCSGNAHTWTWPDPETAPYADVSATSTWTQFLIGTVDPAPFYLPWHYQQGYSGIMFKLLAVGDDLSTVEFRARAYTVLSTALFYTGPNGKARRSKIQGYFEGRWRDDQYNCPVTSAFKLVPSESDENLPGNRRMCFDFQTQITDTWIYDVDLAAKSKIRLAKLQIWDVFEVQQRA